MRCIEADHGDRFRYTLLLVRPSPGVIRFLDCAVFVRNKVFGSESSAIADVYYWLMCDHTECEYRRELWLGVSVVQVPDT